MQAGISSYAAFRKSIETILFMIQKCLISLVLAEHSTPASSKMPTVLQTSVLAFDLVTTATTSPTATLTLPPAEPTFFILTVIVPVVGCVLLVLFVAIIVIITVLAWRKRHQPSNDSW